MLKSLFKNFKVIVKQLAIAFFFTSFFIFITFALFSKKIEATVKLINKVAVMELGSNTSNRKISINTVTKSLTNYPLYGEIWGRIEIPVAEIESNIYQGDNLELLKYGVGHLSGSFFPGEGGVIVIPGHNSSREFQRLVKVKKNDLIIIKAVYGTFTYKMDSFEILEAKELNEKLELTRDEEILLLYTCYPVDTPGYKSKRYVVYAKLVGEEYE